MKKSPIVFILFILCLGVTAGNFKQSFYVLLKDSEFEKADSVLTEWQKAEPNNSEIYAARFNLYFNSAGSSIMVLDSDTLPEGDALMLVDSLGQLAGSITERKVWNDSILAKCFKAIDQGIELFPDRLDFRCGKATACIMIEDWGLLNSTAKEILERNKFNKGAWIWTDDEALPADTAAQIMFDAIHEYERTLAENSNPDELIDLNLELFPDDEKALTLKGGLAYYAGDRKKAFEYMEKAHRAAPSDHLITCNLAYLYYESGQKENAVELYQRVLEDKDAEEEWKEVAEEMINRINQE